MGVGLNWRVKMTYIGFKSCFFLVIDVSYYYVHRVIIAKKVRSLNFPNPFNIFMFWLNKLSNPIFKWKWIKYNSLPVLTILLNSFPTGATFDLTNFSELPPIFGAQSFNLGLLILNYRARHNYCFSLPKYHFGYVIWSK